MANPTPQPSTSSHQPSTGRPLADSNRASTGSPEGHQPFSTLNQIQPRPGDILLFARAKGLNHVITWFTRSPYYHVAIFESDTNVIEARPRGVVRRDLRTREGGHAFAVIPAPNESGTKALAWAVAHIGAGYDRVDVFVIILERVFRHLKINWTARNKFSCGEFVAMAFQETGTPLFPQRPLDDIVPGDFAPLLPPSSNFAI